MKTEEIAQWVIENRYPKSENDKVTDLEMFHALNDKIKQYAEECVKASFNKASDVKDQFINPKSINKLENIILL
jgi:hypothetical protein